jgi:hypothetical protein
MSRRAGSVRERLASHGLIASARDAAAIAKILDSVTIDLRELGATLTDRGEPVAP